MDKPYTFIYSFSLNADKITAKPYQRRGISVSEITNDDLLPIYNIKAVSTMLELLPVTIRAWERRYGLPSPIRGKQGYRLYSAHDVRLLRWLKKQNDSGMSIGQSARYLSELLNAGKDPAAEAPQKTSQSLELSLQQTISIENLQKDFLQYLSHYNDSQATETLRRAFSIYSVDQVLNQVVEPTMVALGEGWQRGEISIAIEHFATQFCIQHLMGMLSASNPPSREGILLAACAPGEMHQIGLLSLVVTLRWRGWDVKYFGQDLSLNRIEETIMETKPDAILFTATRKEYAAALRPLQQIFNKYPYPKPLLILGGKGFQGPETLPVSFGEIINLPLSQSIEMIENRIYQRALTLP